MKIKVISFGKIKSEELFSLAKYYQKLCSKYLKLEIVELKDIRDRKVMIEDIKSFFGNSQNIFLTENGLELTTLELSRKINNWKNTSVDVNFFIANAFGFDASLLNNKKETLSLSKMTFTHEFAKVLLLEQLYRASDILAGGKYHK